MQENNIETRYRINLELAPAYRDELSRLRAVTGLNNADLLRHALTLLRIYVQAAQRGEEVRVFDRQAPETQTRIELPFIVTPGGE